MFAPRSRTVLELGGGCRVVMTPYTYGEEYNPAWRYVLVTPHVQCDVTRRYVATLMHIVASEGL